MLCRTRFVSTLALACLSAVSLAEQGGPPTGWSREIGPAVIINPSYQGSDDYNVQPVPFVDFRYRDERGVKYFANVPQGLGGYLYRSSNKAKTRHAVSLALAPGFANRDPDDLDGLDTFGPSVEARLGWEFTAGPWALGATVSQALGTGHEGFYGELSAAWRQRLGNRGFLSFGPNLRFGNAQYMDAFYGVTGSEAVRTGLDTFEADAGLESVGVQAVVSVPLSRAWRFTAVTPRLCAHRRCKRQLADGGRSSGLLPVGRNLALLGHALGAAGGGVIRQRSGLPGELVNQRQRKLLLAPARGQSAQSPRPAFAFVSQPLRSNRDARRKPVMIAEGPGTPRLRTVVVRHAVPILNVDPIAPKCHPGRDRSVFPQAGNRCDSACRQPARWQRPAGPSRPYPSAPGPVRSFPAAVSTAPQHA